MGTGNGFFNQPRSVVTSGSSTYVADSGNHRITRFDSSTGAFTGWIGRVNTVPTGNTAGVTGCTTTAVSAKTPGWCMGGTAKTGTGDGHFNWPNGLATDGTNLYVTDAVNHRISRFTLSTGVFTGWIGNINSTTGRTVCTGAASSFSTGWCMGGTAKLGTGNGMMNIPINIVLSGSNMYVTDRDNHRVNRYQISNGAFLGWIGGISTSPTGNAAGTEGTCAGATGVTPGWCLGGTSATKTTPGGFSGAQRLAIDSTSIYVTEYGNHRVSRFDLTTGAFTGWLGKINTSPTGNGSGFSGSDCSAASGVTPGWCMGGTSTSGAGDGMLNYPLGIDADNNYLYVSDSLNFRINRYLSSTGEFSGWMGRILTVPTGGETGCTSSYIGDFTPGWCIGGSSQSGSGPGALNAADGIYVIPNGLLITEQLNYRLSRWLWNQ